MNKKKNFYFKLPTLLLVIVVMVSCNTDNKKENKTNVTIFKNGHILTVDKNFAVVETMAIKNDQIIAVGAESEVLEAIGSVYETYDLKGKTLLPGFIDAHAHIVAGSMLGAMEYVGMERFSTTKEVLEYIANLVKTTQAGEWIGARNWDPSIQDGPSELTSAVLDSISTDHPIFITNASGHLAYANSKAFELANISDDVVNPEGAEFVKDANGELTGVMKNMISFLQVWSANPAMQTFSPVEGILNGSREINEVGITTTSELALGATMGGAAEADMLFNMAESGKLKTRIRAYPFYINENSWDSSKYHMNYGNSLIRLTGFKLVADGSNQGFTGLQRDPYHCCGGHGQAYTSPEELNRLVLDRAKEGWQLALHGNGDQAIDNILDAIENAKNAGIDVASLRPRIEHCSILQNDQIQRMKDLNVSASFLIGHVHYWGTFMRDSVFGPEKVELLDRCVSVEKANISFTLHSDYPVSNPNPLHMIEMAVTRKTWKEPEYVLAPQEKISVESAIRAMTSEAAWQLMSEHEIGSLEVGKLADFVILNEDPLAVDPDIIKNIKIMETWVNGERVYMNK